MGSNRTRDRYQGLWIPLDPQSTDSSGAERAGPRPGPVVADQPSALRWIPSGSQQAGDEYDFRAQRAGYPTGKASGLGVLWRPHGAINWRAFDEPGTVAACRALVEAETGDALEPRYPSPHPLQSGELLYVYGAENSSDSAEEVWCRRYDPITASYSTAVRIYQHPNLYATGWEAHPQLLQLPSGRVLCIWIVYRPGGVNASMAYSDDNGDTWTLGATDILPADLEPNAAAPAATGYQSSHGLAIIYHPLGLGLSLSVRRADTSGAEATELRQYASDSLGSAFQLVDSTSTNDVTAIAAYEVCAYPVLLNLNGSILLLAATANSPSTELSVYVRLLGDPWQPFTEVTPVDAGGQAGDSDSATTAAAGDMAAWLASNGSVYTLTRGSDALLRVRRSQDAGATWEAVGTGLVTADFDSNVYTVRHSACWWQERAVVLHQGDATAGTTEPTVGFMSLGGWTTVPRPPADSGYSPHRLAVLPRLWLPYTLPDNAGWGLTGAGGTTLTPSGVVINASAASAIYDIDPGGDIDTGLTLEVEITPTTGGTAADQVAILCRLADSTDDFQITIRVGTAGILVRDDNAANTLDTLAVDTTAGVILLVDMVGDSVRVYWRPRSIGSDRNFELLAESDTLVSDAGSPAASNRIEIGCQSLGVAEVHRISYGGNTAVGAHLIDRSTPRDLTCLHPARSRIYIDRDLWITPRDGPAYAADSWTSKPTYNYPATALSPLLHPSPRRKWRSTAVAATNEHVWIIDADGNRIPSALLSLLGIGTNFRTFNLRRRDGGGTWSTVSAVDVATGMTSLPFTRAGLTMVPGVGATGSLYLHQSEAVGWSVDFGGGVVRRIVAQSEGQWGGSGKQAVITLESNSGVGGSGSMALVPDAWIAVVPVPLTDNYRAVAAQITAQGTADGYFAAGILWPGLLDVFGFLPSWGSGGLELAGEVEETVFRDGQRKRVQRAPVQRLLTASWVDGIDMTKISTGNVDPDYRTPWTSGRIGATWQGTPTYLAGVLRDLQAGAIPCAWIRRFNQGTGTIQLINRREQFIYGHLEGQVTIDHVQGDVDYNEVTRIGSVSLREQP